MYTTTKPTVYLIDGLNLVRSFLWEFSRTEDEVTADFLDFLSEVSADERFCMHEYRVVFDGAYRNVGPLYRNGVQIIFSEEDTADRWIYDEALYLADQGKRVIAVTDDRALQESLKELGVKTQFCKKFYHSLKIV